MDPRTTPLLTDLYQLNMMQAYLDHRMTGTAVFEFFVRKLPARRGFLVAAGLAQVVDFLSGMSFADEELDWVRGTGRFSDTLIDYLATLRFAGDVDAVPEGTVVFADEPLIRIVAPLPIAQLVETRLISLAHFQTLIASKAARMVLAAPGKTLIDFGLRRAHGSEAGVLAARAAYIAGFAGTATVIAEPLFGVPIFGTMAHSFIQAHDDESAAFENFARSRPANLVLLVDTYDIATGARRVVGLAPRLRAEGIDIAGVRIDSGDLAAGARLVRRILDDGGLKDVRIFVSGGLDENQIAGFVADGAPIDGYGVGTSLTTSEDAPAFDCAYKLQEYLGIPRRKRSQGKATWPGRKQVFRRYDGAGRMTGDILTIEEDAHDGAPLLQPVMRDGRLVAPLPDLIAIRTHAAAELARLPENLRHLRCEPGYPVRVAPALQRLAEQADRRLAAE